MVSNHYNLSNHIHKLKMFGGRDKKENFVSLFYYEKNTTRLYSFNFKFKNSFFKFDKIK